MTDEELIYAANETIEQLKDYEEQLLARHRGKIVKAYGAKTFQVDKVEYRYGHMNLQGFVLKADGTCGVRRYGQWVEDAEFVEP